MERDLSLLFADDYTLGTYYQAVEFSSVPRYITLCWMKEELIVNVLDEIRWNLHMMW